eukprot:1144094-Pelagomonas_calceolata.AAC.2
MGGGVPQQVAPCISSHQGSRGSKKSLSKFVNHEASSLEYRRKLQVHRLCQSWRHDDGLMKTCLLQWSMRAEYAAWVLKGTLFQRPADMDLLGIKTLAKRKQSSPYAYQTPPLKGHTKDFRKKSMKMELTEHVFPASGPHSGVCHLTIMATILGAQHQSLG